MKMTRLFISMMALSLVMYSCGGGAQTEEASETTETEATAETAAVEEEVTRTVNLESSKVMWKGVMLGVKEHTGTVNITEANLATTGTAVSGGSFTVDLTSMEATDENYQPDAGYGKDKLIGHLSSPDFFDTESYPTATFEITSVDGNVATGNLTVRGKTNEETVTDIAVEEVENGMKITGKLVFDRQKYDVAFPGPAPDMVISDEIELDLMIMAN